MAGLLIAIEGPEGAGKTTLAQRLARRLREAGVDVLEVREPGGTPVAEAARRLALDPELEVTPLAELFLILAARADLVAKVIKPALAAGRVVVTDRFDLSTEAYQIEGRGLPREAVLQANRLATGELRPHLTLVLDVPHGVGRARQAKDRKSPDRLEGEPSAWHERVGRAFARASGPAIVHLDATRPVEAVERDAWHILQRQFQETFGNGKG
ncbi:MAG: dTMP kinase [Gemmatimonadetes bacterium]|nr:dTMP kinase [Gemmatimonadota bacterium]